MLIRSILCAVTLSVWAMTGWAEDDNITAFGAGDPEMNAAIMQAQETLPIFLRNTVDAEGYGPRGGFLKVRFEVNAADADAEVIWIGPFAVFDDQDFVGILANEPRWMAGLSAGDQVSFEYDMIVDWSISDGAGQRYGDYTTRVIFGQMPKEDAAEMLATFAQPPVPSDWK